VVQPNSPSLDGGLHNQARLLGALRHENGIAFCTPNDTDVTVGVRSFASHNSDDRQERDGDRSVKSFDLRR
jgi:hypothetical protein